MNHSNIVKFFDYLQVKPKVYLLLEYASNGNLFWYIRKQGYLPDQEAARLFKQTAEALAYLHSKSYIHRDMKPENLLLDKDGQIKLCDFGWCAEYEEDSSMRNTFCGTYEYMAPEIFEKKPYDEKVDVWCLGILLYELVHGKSPFKGNTVIDIYNNIKKGNIRFSSRCSPEIKDLILNILRRKPAERFNIQQILNHPFLRKFYPVDNKENDINVPNTQHVLHSPHNEKKSGRGQSKKKSSGKKRRSSSKKKNSGSKSRPVTNLNTVFLNNSKHKPKTQSYSIMDEFKSPRIIGAKYFLGNQIGMIETPKTPSAAKRSRRGESRRYCGRSYLQDITHTNDLLNYSSMHTGHSQPKTSNMHVLNSSTNHIYKTYDLPLSIANKGSGDKTRQASGEIKPWISRRKNSLFGSKQFEDHSDQELIRDLINRKMSQVKTKLRSAKLERNYRTKTYHNEYNTVKTHRIKPSHLEENNKQLLDSKNKSCKEKMTACRQLLDRISVCKMSDIRNIRLAIKHQTPSTLEGLRVLYIGRKIQES